MTAAARLTRPEVVGVMVSVATHPFLDSTFEIRWSQHTPELIAPAIEAALAGAQAAIDAVA